MQFGIRQSVYFSNADNCDEFMRKLSGGIVVKLKKYRGQHLLTDRNMLEKIVREASVSRDDDVIEIGAGTGLLTELLAENAGSVKSFEIDRDFRERLEELAGGYDNLEIIMHDFLSFRLADFLREQGKKWKVVANIPYNITSPIIEKLIEEGLPHFTDIFLLVQKEVARRITAKPGGKDYGRLTVYARFFFDTSMLFTVPPEVFTPPPSVDSALLRMKPLVETPDVNPRTFFAVVASAFAQRRKQIRNAVKNSLPGVDKDKIDEILEKAGIDKQRRGETLSIDEFAQLSRVVDQYSESMGIQVKNESQEKS
jgi:16S rRNA (adenine1518-N6/adenine1519-N6)-dimethyltransferase